MASADKTVTKVVQYILFQWLADRMEINPGSTPLPKPAMFLSQLPPLQYKSVEVIMGRHYSLELNKEPSVYWLKELAVNWQPQLDSKTPPECINTTISNKVVPHPSGFYRVVTESSTDYEYLIRLHITRV